MPPSLREASISMPFGTKADATPSNAPSGAGTGAGSNPGKEQRVTKQRVAVSTALDELDDFVSTQELYRILQNKGVSVSLATAYRILQSLADDGLVDVLRNGEGEAVYRRCAVTGHHHHLLCRNCGKAVEVEAPAVETWAARTAAEHGYTEVAHTVEIFGLCPDCTALRAAGKL
ncbi:Fur family ferric uptake transcriptional regulator [Pseudarthrobacter sulfonivorans]|nr:Fur family ferric uptake transcriptional regulator [Pseudarthrobacter sulfonivorans]